MHHAATVTATVTAGVTAPAPGEATRRYLAALRDRGPLDIDWRTAPARHKRYPGAPGIVLPWTGSPEGADASPVGELLRELLGVARLIWFHEVDDTGRPVGGGAPLLLLGRPAPSGGALYPIEAYVAIGGPATAGLYHYDPVHHLLERVRDGDHRAALAEIPAVAPAVRPDVVLVLSAVFWRSMFKYGDYGYRLVCQETGVLLAQALAAGERLGMAGDIRLRFPDPRVDRLLGLDGRREGALAVLFLELPDGPVRPGRSVDPEDPPPPAPESTPKPRCMPSDGAAAALHEATRIPVPMDGAAGGSPPGALVPDAAPAAGEAAESAAGRAAPATASSVPEFALPAAAPVRLADGVPRRASPPAGFRPVPIAAEALAAVLDAAAGPYPSDLVRDAPTSEFYLLAQRVSGLRPGAYRYDRERRVLRRVAGESAIADVRGGRLLPNTQVALPGAAAVLIPVGDPLAGVRWHGDRWYRMQEIETGLVLQRATLAASALGLVARFYSDGANDTTDRVLGLAGTSRRSLSFLGIGTPRTGGPSLARRIPSGPRKEVVAG